MSDNAHEVLEEKISFLIETMEDNFINIEELRSLFEKQLKDNAHNIGAANWHRLSYDTTEAWLILICNFTVRWSIKHGIAPHVLADHMNRVMQIVYSLDIAERLRQVYEGDDKGDRLDDYRS